MIDESFIRSIGIIVIAASIFALLARALTLPSIVAYLATGLVLGPLFGILESSTAIHLIAETGIILLLFLVGLELSFEKVKGVGLVTVIAGTSQIFLTVLFGFFLSLILGIDKGPALILSIALTFSSTVIVVKLLVDRQDSNSRYGQIAIGILLIQDLFVVILLTLINGLEGSGTFEFAIIGKGLLQAFGGMILLLSIVLAISKWLLVRPFTWAAQSPETLFIWSLCWCFLIVSATHFLHLSPEIGAFIAGISLAQLPYHRDLKRRVQPLIHFFIAVFFVVLGLEMKIDVPFTFWAKAAVMASFVVIGKFTIIMFIVARLGYSERTSFKTALLLTQISEFSFIFIALEVEAGFVGDDIAALVGLIGLISITISTVSITYGEALYKLSSGLGFCRMFRATPESKHAEPSDMEYKNHIIIVGMNSLGIELINRLEKKGEEVLAIDIDPGKLKNLPSHKLLGDASSTALLKDAYLEDAKLLVSTLHIEMTNDLLAFYCNRLGVPCSIHAMDVNAVDNLLEMEVDHMIAPKADGLKRQNQLLGKLGYIET